MHTDRHRLEPRKEEETTMGGTIEHLGAIVRELSVSIRVCPRFFSLLASVALALFSASLACAAESKVLSLTLDRGDKDSIPVVLDITTTNDRFDPLVWGTAYGYNLSQHTGTVSVVESSGDRIRLSVKLAIERDPAAPRSAASYELNLARQGKNYSGGFTGIFNDVAVTGTVLGAVSEPVVKQIQGHDPLQSGEHPRLIFRKKDMPELRRRMDTPEGKAILSMLNERAPLREVSQVTDRHTSWMAANWGVIHQLTGDKDAARKARATLIDEVITKPMPWDRNDIHHASRLLGIALTYDLCYEAWDKEFRCLLAEYIRVASSELSTGFYEGFPMDEKAFDPTPWGHRNAIRMSCAGLAALAILGDSDAEGRALPDTDRVLRSAERHVTQYLRMGVTQTGTGIEGVFPKDFALADGVLQFMHASRVALGRDFSSVNPMLLAGNVLRSSPGESNAYNFALSSISIQTSGLWPMGLGTVPESFLPAMKWCFDRDAGLQGKQHFGCAYPYQAAYALMNYPFAIESKTPGGSLPLHAVDTLNGHILLRNGWGNKNDPMVEIYLNALGLPPVKGKEADLTAGVLNVSGFGATWMRGFAGSSRMNDGAAADVLYSECDGKQAFVGMDLSDLYLESVAERPKPLGKTRAFVRIQKRQWQRDAIQSFINPVVSPRTTTQSGPKKGTGDLKPLPNVIRHVAVDLTGDCGAPVLIVIVERATGDVPARWRIPVRAAAAVAGGFVAGDSKGANFAGRFIAPSDARQEDGQIAGKGDFFVVFTLQQGPAPASTVEGTGMDAKVRIGGRTIAYNGHRIVLGK